MAFSGLVSNPARRETEAWDKRTTFSQWFYSPGRGVRIMLCVPAPPRSRSDRDPAPPEGREATGTPSPRSRSVRDPAQGCEATETPQPTNNSP